jgi:hypothetical protein
MRAPVRVCVCVACECARAQVCMSPAWTKKKSTRCGQKNVTRYGQKKTYLSVTRVWIIGCFTADESERNGSNIIELRAVAPAYLKATTVLSKVSRARLPQPLPVPFSCTDAHPSTHPTTHHHMNTHLFLSKVMDASA